MPASPERPTPAPATVWSWSSVARCRVSSSRSGGRQDEASLLGTRHRSHTRGRQVAGLVGHHVGATMERAEGERVNERALAREWYCAAGRLVGRSVNSQGWLVSRSVNSQGWLVGRSVNSQGWLVGRSVNSQGWLVGRSVNSQGWLVGRSVNSQGWLVVRSKIERRLFVGTICLRSGLFFVSTRKWCTVLL